MAGGAAPRAGALFREGIQPERGPPKPPGSGGLPPGTRGLCREKPQACVPPEGAEVASGAPESLEDGACGGREGAPWGSGGARTRHLLGLSFRMEAFVIKTQGRLIPGRTSRQAGGRTGGRSSLQPTWESPSALLLPPAHVPASALSPALPRLSPLTSLPPSSPVSPSDHGRSLAEESVFWFWPQAKASSCLWIFVLTSPGERGLAGLGPVSTLGPIRCGQEEGLVGPNRAWGPPWGGCRMARHRAPGYFLQKQPCFLPHRSPGRSSPRTIRQMGLFQLLLLSATHSLSRRWGRRRQTG